MFCEKCGAEMKDGETTCSKCGYTPDGGAMAVNKTKLGISVGLVAAIAYLTGLFSGYITLSIIVGYVLLFETNEWLRKSVVKAMVICLIFSCSKLVIGFIPDAIRLIDSFVSIFGGEFSVAFITRLCSFAVAALAYAENVILLVYGISAVKGKNVKAGQLDQLVDVHTK